VRSSGRIPKEIPILLIGSDLDGRVFYEHTSTVLLSLHGAGIVSAHKLSPEQELVLRLPDRNKEAEVRVVGHLGSQNGSYTYGVAFFDPHLNFWDHDFPPISPLEMELGLLSLVCNSCKTLEKIDDSSIEADVYATNEGVIRFCKRCGSSTLWKPVLSVMPQESVAPEAAQLSLFSAAAAPASASEQIPAPPSNSNPAPAASPVIPPAPEKSAFLRANRRKHPRVKVRYSACIRHPERGDDVVTCEDMSKGGICFKSRKHYYAQSLIDVAVPYQPGQPAIFVPAQIVFAEELPEQHLFRYGVQYLKPTKTRDYF
jgi:hypothetical protein